MFVYCRISACTRSISTSRLDKTLQLHIERHEKIRTLQQNEFKCFLDNYTFPDLSIT